MRRLIIGDIHGCFAELQDLLDKVGVASDDEVIAIGIRRSREELLRHVAGPASW